MNFLRLQCHACGTRQHWKSSGIKEFQCSSCQAWNFLDSNGDYIDPPADLINQQENLQPQHRNDGLIASFSSQQDIFCQTCLRNQHVYNELLSQYLPDESDPRYSSFETSLPQYKHDLEKRYPQICKSCAPRAQSMIHEADYYSMTNNASRLMDRSRGGRRSASPVPAYKRDTWTRMATRVGLTLIRWLLMFSAAYQVFWHIFAVAQLQQGFSTGYEDVREDFYDIPAADYKASQCMEEISRLCYSYGCFRLIGGLTPKLLAISFFLIWYNPGIEQTYRSDVRIASVYGWQQHLVITFLVLAGRAAVYNMTNDITANGFSIPQRQAVHATAAILIVVGHVVANLSISTEKWKVNGNIMPRPEQKDVLGQYAGPASESHISLPSNQAPTQLLARESSQQFPIESLAPRRSTRHKLTTPVVSPPSPPGSELGDPMDIEPIAPAHAQNSSFTGAFGRSTGWNGIRTNLFSIEDELRARQERSRQGHSNDKHTYFQPSQPTAFRGQLPHPPMSQERKLRNPMSQVPQFKESRITQRQDFLQEMKNGIDRGRGFTKRDRSIDSDRTEVSTPAIARTRGQLDLAASDWHLETDVNAATGLEDIFGGTFKIDEPSGVPQLQPRASYLSVRQYRYQVIAVLLLAFAGAFVFDVAGLRRSLCLFLVDRMEAMGI